jgi:hypothetical protein
MPIENRRRSAHRTNGSIAPGRSLNGLGVIIPQESKSIEDSQFGDLEWEDDERIHKGDEDDQPADFQNNLYPRKPRSAAGKAPTKTMLNAYVLMRGRQDTEERGPLYREGFIQPPWDQKPEDVRPGEPRISPPLPYGNLYDSLPVTLLKANNISVYADKDPEEKGYAATPDLRKISDSRRRSSSEILNMMGYMKLNGKITDPDSKDDVFRALNGIRGDTPPIPGLNDRVTKRVHIMTPSELQKFYAHFVQDVSDDEGNPLHQRISPGTFRDWAEGAKKKKNPNTNRIEERVKAAEMKGEKPPGNSKYKKWSMHSPQFDQETGAILTPAYSIDEFPSPLRSPQSKRSKVICTRVKWLTVAGVDLDNVPSMLTYMLPEVGRMLARVTLYDGGDIEDPGEPPSELETITDVSKQQGQIATWSKLNMFTATVGRHPW